VQEKFRNSGQEQFVTKCFDAFLFLFVLSMPLVYVLSSLLSFLASCYLENYSLLFLPSFYPVFSSLGVFVRPLFCFFSHLIIHEKRFLSIRISLEINERKREGVSLGCNL